MIEKLEAEKERDEHKALQDMKIELVRGSFAIAAKAENPQMPQWLSSVIQQVLPNIAIPLAAENESMQQEMAAHQQQMEQQAMVQQELAQMSPEEREAAMQEMQQEQQQQQMM